MAIIKTTSEFLDNEELFDLLMEAFDKIEQIRMEANGIHVFRVQSDEVPKEDKQISFLAQRLAAGVKPVITQFEILD